MKKLESITDEELALRYVDGDNTAFDELLTRNQTKLFTYIMFVVRDRELANDIFQETFVKVITRLQEGKYSPSGKFLYWLTRIAHNVIMDWYRLHSSSKRRGCWLHLKNRLHSSSKVMELTEDNDLSNLKVASVMDKNREAELINEQILVDVKRLMNQLPTPQREVVYMRFYQDMSFKEIAACTGVSINTSLGRMRYAIMNLRRMAKEHNVQLNFEV